MQLKRFISFMVAVLMIATMVIPVAAVENETFEVGVEVGTETPISSNLQIYKTGDTVSVRIFAAKNTGIRTIRFQLYYDANALTLESVKDNHLFSAKDATSVKENKDGKKYINYVVITDNVISGDNQDLYTATFKVNKDFDGAADFSVSINSYKDCSRPDVSSNTGTAYVPFVGKTVTIQIHNDCEVTAAKAPDCTNIGWNEYKICKLCGYSTYVEIPAVGHKLVDHNAKTSTCTEIGWEAYQTCENCDYTTYVEIPATGHTYVDHEAQAATCTEIGWEAYQTCENCDYTTYVEIPATGVHTGGTATCVAKAVCDVCGGEYGEINADNHAGETEIRDAVEATNKNDGFSGNTHCKDCDAKIADGEVIPRIVVSGDVNYDSNIDVFDVTAILKHLADWSIEVDVDAADVDGNGVVDVFDVTRLLKYLAGWAVTLD